MQRLRQARPATKVTQMAGPTPSGHLSSTDPTDFLVFSHPAARTHTHIKKPRTDTANGRESEICAEKRSRETPTDEKWRRNRKINGRFFGGGKRNKSRKLSFGDARVAIATIDTTASRYNGSRYAGAELRPLR